MTAVSSQRAAGPGGSVGGRRGTISGSPAPWTSAPGTASGLPAGALAMYNSPKRASASPLVGHKRLGNAYVPEAA
jgi:hypothetical protein